MCVEIVLMSMPEWAKWGYNGEGYFPQWKLYIILSNETFYNGALYYVWYYATGRLQRKGKIVF